MKSNKTVKVKEFVKKRKNAIIGASLLTLGCAIGWYGSKKHLGSLVEGLDRVRKGSDLCYEESFFDYHEGTIKGLSRLGERILEYNKIADPGSITEDTKVTGLMVFIKKD